MKDVNVTGSWLFMCAKNRKRLQYNITYFWWLVSECQVANSARKCYSSVCPTGWTSDPPGGNNYLLCYTGICCIQIGKWKQRHGDHHADGCDNYHFFYKTTPYSYWNNIYNFKHYNMSILRKSNKALAQNCYQQIYNHIMLMWHLFMWYLNKNIRGFRKWGGFKKWTPSFVWCISSIIFFGNGASSPFWNPESTPETCCVMKGQRTDRQLDILKGCEIFWIRKNMFENQMEIKYFTSVLTPKQ